MLHVFSASPLAQGFLLGFTTAVCSIVVGYILAEAFIALARVSRSRRARHDDAQLYLLPPSRRTVLPNGQVERGPHERLR